jgi:hypothetical protein
MTASPQATARSPCSASRGRLAALAATAVLAACAGTPVPDWQAAARDALDAGTAAYLRGDARVAQAEFERARRELARTGRADLLARAALVRCAAQVASAVVDSCSAFEALRSEAAAAERAYADYLAGRVQPQDIAQLPPQHRAVAAAQGDGAAAALRAIDDPLAQLVAVGVLFQRGEANPAALALAVDTASAKGWRRPLLAWLGVLLARAQHAGASAEAERLRRRIALVQGER